MHRLTITVVTAEDLDGTSMYAGLADKLEQIAEELRTNPGHASFAAFGRSGVNLYYALDSDEDAALDVPGALDWQPGIPYISRRRA